MRELTFLTLLFATLVFTSCQKEVDPNATPQGSGNGTGSATRTSYYPATAGSWWKFKDSANGTITNETIVDRTRTINNIVYTAMFGDNGTQKDTGWVASPQPNYYMAAKGVSPNTGAYYDLTFHYLNDTASIGYNWIYNAGQGNGFTAYIRTTIVERNISMTVEGKSYSNVIHTRLDFSYDLLGTIMDAAVYDYFIAKGVGIIKVRSDFANMGISFKACTNLIDYSIK